MQHKKKRFTGLVRAAIAKCCLTMSAFLALIVSIGAAANAQALHSFSNSSTDGDSPNGGMVLDTARALYGTTKYGGSTFSGVQQPGYGTLYKLSPPTTGTGAWTEQILHNFDPSLGDGEIPQGDLLINQVGTLYGATLENVFTLSPPSSPGGTWTETILYAFPDGTPNAEGGVIADPSGDLYGVNSTETDYQTDGSIYQLTPPSQGQTAWTEQVLYQFSQGAPGGSVPDGPLVRDSSGNLYGTTQYGGGSCNCGVVYELSPPAAAHATWTQSVLYIFTGGADGAKPTSGLALAANGSLYGSALLGGIRRCIDGCGTVFSLTPPSSAGAAWRYDVLHQFTSLPDGFGPGQVAVASNGDVYGPTLYGGISGCQNGCGTFFRLAKPSSGQGNWTETVSASPSYSVGRGPTGPVLLGPDNTLYGAVNGGGADGGGLVFKKTLFTSQ